jgi:hypothetical protein
MRMDATARLWLSVLLLFAVAAPAWGGAFTSRNFVVTAPNDQIAEQCAKTAEYYRKHLAIQWVGEEFPPWNDPCKISVKVGQIGAGGSTTFTFDRGEVFGWDMKVQGTLERILDSVIPHEVNHTIFATHFRRPLPRWADEGAASLVEHESERMRQVALLNEVIMNKDRIPLGELFEITEYPKDMRKTLTLYAEGYSLAEFLVQKKGKEGRAIYLKFLEDANNIGWEQATQQHYGFRGVGDLEQQWSSWVVAGSPPIRTKEDPQLAISIPAKRPRSALQSVEAVVRGQTPLELPPLPMIGRRPRQLLGELNAPEPGQKARVAMQDDQR